MVHCQVICNKNILEFCIHVMHLCVRQLLTSCDVMTLLRVLTFLNQAHMGLYLM